MIEVKNKKLIFSPKGKIDWAVDTALQPTPLVLDDRIRVYAGFRDVGTLKVLEP